MARYSEITLFIQPRATMKESLQVVQNAASFTDNFLGFCPAKKILHHPLTIFAGIST